MVISHYKDNGILLVLKTDFSVKASSSKKELEKAYRASRYEVFFPVLTIQIGQFHSNLDEFLMDNNAFSWAFVSAWNPFSKVLSDTENDARHTKLLQWLQQESFDFCEGQGAGDNWTPEKSVLILDISLEKAIELGRHFEQNALVFGMVNQVAELVWCAD